MSSSFIYEFLQLSSWMDYYLLDPPQKLDYKYKISLRFATTHVMSYVISRHFWKKSLSFYMFHYSD